MDFLGLVWSLGFRVLAFLAWNLGMVWISVPVLVRFKVNELHTAELQDRQRERLNKWRTPHVDVVVTCSEKDRHPLALAS